MSIFQEMEFTLFDGLVPSNELPEFCLAAEDQLDGGILFPGDSLVKNEVGLGDFLTGSSEDPFSQEWMESMDLSSFLNETASEQNSLITETANEQNSFIFETATEENGLVETVNQQAASIKEEVLPKPTGSSRLLEELLTQPIKIKSSPTVSKNEQLDLSEIDTSSVEVHIPDVETGNKDTSSFLEEAIQQIDGFNALLLNQQLHDIYNSSISSSDGTENTSSEISLMDTSNEFLISSPLSSEDIDSILGSEPSSPADSVEDDPDYVPSIPDEKSSKRSRKSRKGSKSRPSPYDKPEKPVEKLDKKERKRIQNRNAAIRYREKKRAERGNIHSEEDILAARNKELKTKVEHLSNEISYMKNLLTEVCEARGLKIQFK